MKTLTIHDGVTREGVLDTFDQWGYENQVVIGQSLPAEENQNGKLYPFHFRDGTRIIPNNKYYNIYSSHISLSSTQTTSLPLTASYRKSTPGLCDRSFLISADKCPASEASYPGGSTPAPACKGTRLRLLSGCAKDPMPSRVLYRPLPDLVTGSKTCAAPPRRRPPQQPTRSVTARATP
jgi:hypothetical protein